MESKVSVYIATSLDGYIAEKDGGIEWLHDPRYGTPDNLGLSYDDFISTVDVLVMGRKSYEKVRSFPTWSYPSTPVVVLTQQNLSIPSELKDTVDTTAGDPWEIIEALNKKGQHHIYLDGGLTIQRFLAAGLVDEITITQIPIVLGDGIPLFSPQVLRIHLEHLNTSTSSNGFVQNRYRLINKPKQPRDS